SDPGTYVQQVGYAVSETELMVELHPYEAILGEVFEGLPALVFIKGLEMTVSMFLEDYLVEGIDPESLRYEFRGLPTWISSTQVVFNELSFTGEADKVGDYTVDMIVSGDNATTVVPLRIEVIDAPKVKMTLSPGGEIAKSGVTIFAGPDDYDLSINIVGDYDAYQIIFDGSDGGFTEGNISNPVLSNQSLAVGMHSISIELFKQTGYDQDLEEPIYTSILIDSRQFFIGKNVGEGNPNKVINVQLDPYGTELSSAGAIVEHDDGGV